MFGRDPVRTTLEGIAGVLGTSTDPSWRGLMRQALAQGGVIGVAHGCAQQVFTLGQVPGNGIFELASVTKPFTAALAARLVQEGALGWDSPLRQLGGAMRSLPPHLTPFTLATHTAGVPTHPARAALTTFTNFYDPYGGMEARSVINSARRWSHHTSTPRFMYSNLGFGVLALALAQVSGHEPSSTGYVQALRERVLEPYQLPDITAQPPPARLVLPRGLLGGPEVTGFGGLMGAGGLYGSAHDLLAFTQAHLRGQAGRYWQQSVQPPGLLPPFSAVAPGWFHSEPDGGVIVWHDGVARGTRTALGFRPDTGARVVILARGGVPVLGQRAAVPLLLLRLLGFKTLQGSPVA